MTSTRNDEPRPRLEITTAAVRNPGVTVELEPAEVSGGGREIRKKVKLIILQHYMQVYWYGITVIPRKRLTLCFKCKGRFSLKSAPTNLLWKKCSLHSLHMRIYQERYLQQQPCTYTCSSDLRLVVQEWERCQFINI